MFTVLKRISPKQIPLELYLAVTCVCFVLFSVFHQLHFEWVSNSNYSHGWFVPLLSAYMIIIKIKAEHPKPAPPKNRSGIAGIHALLFFSIWLLCRLIQEANPDWRLVNVIMVSALCALGKAFQFSDSIPLFMCVLARSTRGTGYQLPDTWDILCLGRYSELDGHPDFSKWNHSFSSFIKTHGCGVLQWYSIHPGLSDVQPVPRRIQKSSSIKTNPTFNNGSAHSDHLKLHQDRFNGRRD